MIYEVRTEGHAYETYLVEAGDEDEARRKVLDGEANVPTVSEVEGSEITSVTLREEQ